MGAMDLYVVCFFVGYFVGSVMCANVVSRFFGVNINAVGSENPGATNVTRVLGRLPGVLVFLGDFLKSFVIVALILHSGLFPDGNKFDFGVVGLLGAILGHNAPVFFRFRGGKGISVTMGGIFALMPSVAAIGAIIWCFIFWTTGFVSLASLFFALSLPVTSFAFGYDMHGVILAIFLCVIIFLRHRRNIVRLCDGSEYRFERK